MVSLLLLVLWVVWVSGVRRLLRLGIGTLLLLLVWVLRSPVAAGSLWWWGAVVTTMTSRVTCVVGAVLAARLAVLDDSVRNMASLSRGM